MKSRTNTSVFTQFALSLVLTSFLLGCNPAPLVGTAIVSETPNASTSTIEPSLTIGPTDTEIGVPTATLTPTSTLTPTPPSTITPSPTETVSPIGLKVGDILSDDRVTLKLREIRFNQGYDRIGSRIAPVSFVFDFTNYSGETILLQFGSDDFTMTDNMGTEVNCWFFHISGAIQEVNEPLENGRTREIVARCGLGQLLPEVDIVTLSINNLSSLPDSTWVHQIPR